MAPSERSFIGLAKQLVKGTAIDADVAYQYMLFQEGAVAPQNIFLPTEAEVGGGAMQNDVDKVGVVSGGALSFIPRPNSLGMLLAGALGKDTTAVAGVAGTKHTFTLPADQFDAPYYTVRSAPGGVFAEKFRDVRVGSLALSWKAADRVRGQVSFQGGLPVLTPEVYADMVDDAKWDADTKIDRGPSLLAPKAIVTFPADAAIKVLSGSIIMGMNIPMDDQWITGSYYPDGFDITSRAFAITMNLKVENKTLYNKMSYDPAGGAVWAADVFKTADFSLEFKSAGLIEAALPYSLKISANGDAAAGKPNVAWTVTPIAIRAGRPITMSVTGVFLANTKAASEPISVELVNTLAASYTA